MDIKCLSKKDESQQEYTPQNRRKGSNESLYPVTTFRLEQSLRIGFIADRHVSSKIIHDMLIELGHRVDHFLGFQEALPLVISGQYDLILITREKGAAATQCEEFLSFVRQQGTPKIGGMPLVVVTELNDPTTLETLFIAGASDVIVKPISETELHHRLHQIIFLVPESIFEGRQREKVGLETKSVNEPNKLTEKKAKSPKIVFWSALVCVVAVIIWVISTDTGLSRLAPEQEKNVIATAIKEKIKQPESVNSVATQHHVEQKKAVTQASTVRPKPKAVIKDIILPGRIVGEKKMAVHSAISGKIARVFVHVGERVSSNQVIAVMDSREAVDTLKKAQIRLNKARKLLQLSVAQYETTLKRNRQGQSNKQRLREAEASRQDAKMEQKSAEEAYQYARASLKNIRIVAKFDGVIAAVLTAKNKRVNKKDTLFTLQKSSKKWIEVDVNAKQKPNLDKGNVIAVFANKNDRASTSWDEKIVVIKPIMARSGITSAWRIQLTLTKGRLRYGQQVYVNLSIRD